MAQKKDTDAFLQTYKELEGALRKCDPDMTVLKYEESLPGEEAEKLRICRQIRNYLQHHGDAKSFLAATDDMTSFVEALSLRLRAHGETAKDRLYRVSALTGADKLSDAAARMVRTGFGWMPVTDKNGCFLGILTEHELLRMIAEGKLSAKISAAQGKHTLSSPDAIVSKDDTLSGLENRKVVVIGKENKYSGVVRW